MRPEDIIHTILPKDIHNPALNALPSAEPERKSVTIQLVAHSLSPSISIEDLKESFFAEAARKQPIIFQVNKIAGKEEITPVTYVDGKTCTSSEIEAAKTLIGADERAEALYIATMGTQELAHLPVSAINHPLAIIQNTLDITTVPHQTGRNLQLFVPSDPNEAITYKTEVNFRTHPKVGEAIIDETDASFTGSITAYATLNTTAQRFELNKIEHKGTPLFNEYVKWAVTTPSTITKEVQNLHSPSSTRQTEINNFINSFLDFAKNNDPEFFDEIVENHANKLLDGKTTLTQLLDYEYETTLYLMEYAGHLERTDLTSEQKTQELKNALAVLNQFIEHFHAQLNLEQKRRFNKQFLQFIKQCVRHFYTQNDELAQKNINYLYLKVFRKAGFRLAYYITPTWAKITAGILITGLLLATFVASAMFLWTAFAAAIGASAVTIATILAATAGAAALFTAVGHLLHIASIQRQITSKAQQVAPEPLTLKSQTPTTPGVSRALRDNPAPVVLLVPAAATSPSTPGTHSEDEQNPNPPPPPPKVG